MTGRGECALGYHYDLSIDASAGLSDPFSDAVPRVGLNNLFLGTAESDPTGHREPSQRVHAHAHQGL